MHTFLFTLMSFYRVSTMYLLDAKVVYVVKACAPGGEQ